MNPDTKPNTSPGTKPGVSLGVSLGADSDITLPPLVSDPMKAYLGALIFSHTDPIEVANWVVASAPRFDSFSTLIHHGARNEDMAFGFLLASLWFKVVSKDQTNVVINTMAEACANIAESHVEHGEFAHAGGRYDCAQEIAREIRAKFAESKPRENSAEPGEKHATT